MQSRLSAARPPGPCLARFCGSALRWLIPIAAFAFAAAASPTLAGAPANDDFPGTTITALPFSDSISTDQATVEPGEPDSECLFGSFSYATVWYTYIPPAGGILVASVDGSNFDAILAVWTESTFPGGGLAEIACSDPINLQKTVAFETEAARTYYFQVGGFEFGEPTGNLQFHLEAGVPATNDDISQATVISSLPFNDAVLTTGSDTEPDEPAPSCLLGDRIMSTVWYSFTAPAGGAVAAYGDGTSYQAVITAWTGSPGDLSMVACALVGGGAGALGFQVQAGTTYYLQIGGSDTDGGTPSGYFQLAFETLNVPPCPRAQFTVNDPPGDTFSSASRVYNAASTSIGSDGQNVCIQVKLQDPLFPKAVKIDDWFQGILLMDFDQNENTGFQGLTDDLCGASSGLGVESLTGFFLDGGLLIPVLDFPITLPLPELKYAVFLAEGDTFKVIVPSSVTDSTFDFALIIGNFMDPTDCVPNNGHLSTYLPILTFGDIDCLGGVSTVDALKLLRFTAELPVAQVGGCPPVDSVLSHFPQPLGDVNCDGVINSIDALAILRYTAGLQVTTVPPCLPIGTMFRPDLPSPAPEPASPALSKDHAFAPDCRFPVSYCPSGQAPRHLPAVVLHHLGDNRAQVQWRSPRLTP